MQTNTKLETVQFGATGMEITRIGFGAWAIGGGGWEFGWGPQEERPRWRRFSAQSNSA